MKEKFFIESGAIKKGHFLLASGLHSEYYFQAQSLLQYPRLASRAGKEIAKKWKKDNIDVAVSLAVGGIVLGQEVARHLKVRHIFLERKKDKFSLERGFELKENERVLLVEDVITTGGSLKEAIEVLNTYRAQITGITSLVLRGNPDFQYPLKSILKIEWQTYPLDNCPLCREQVPLYIPGTKQRLPRRQT
jgi:orotate phosphoribosyltransferase